MADVNTFLQAALEKQRLRDEKNASKEPKKFVKGVRPYNYDNFEKSASAQNQESAKTVEVPPPEIKEIAQVIVDAPKDAIKAIAIEEAKPFSRVPEKSPVVRAGQPLSKHQETIVGTVKAEISANEGHVKYASEEYDEKYSNAAKNLAKGFSRIPNEILFKIMSGDVEPREVRVLIALLRLSNGFGKTWVSVTATYLVDLTRIPSNHIFKCLKSLVEKGLIEKKLIAQEGKNPTNQYKVLFDGKNSFLDYTQDETGFSQKIESYLAAIVVKNQREIEKRAIRELIDSGLSQDEIFEAIALVQNRGMSGSGESPNNPAAYLTKAGSRVFSEIRRNGQRKEHNKAVIRESSGELNTAEIEQNLLAIERFESEFPDTSKRAEVIKQLSDKYKTIKNLNTELSVFLPDTVIIQSWAAGEISI